MNIRLLFLSTLFTLTLIDDVKAQFVEIEGKGDFSLQTQQVNLACQLIRYGYQTKSAMPLILAVQMFRDQKVESETLTATKVEVSSTQERIAQKKVKCLLKRNK